MAVGHIVSGGAAESDGRIRSGDELVSVDGLSVLKASHRQVVQLMNAAANRGQVNLVLRRRAYLPVGMSFASVGINEYLPNSGSHTPIAVSNTQTYDVVVHRNENEGFGFVIISSVNKVGSTIGKFAYNPSFRLE